MLKKQRRGQKVKKQVREHGEGCSSGKYTIALTYRIQSEETHWTEDWYPYYIDTYLSALGHCCDSLWFQ